MYSDLLNGEHFFFFSAYDFIASTRKSASSTMRKSRFRVKRTIEIPSKSIDIYFLFSTRFEQYFLSRKDFLDQSRTTILLLFRLLLFHSKKLDAIFESEAIQSILI